jgi:membrane protease YdiL (CAAX protease family)
VPEVLLVLALVFLLLFALRLSGLEWLTALAVALFPGYGNANLSLLLLMSLVQACLMIGLVLGAARFRSWRAWRLLGLRDCSPRSLLSYGLLGGVAVFMFIALSMALISYLLRLPLQPQQVAYLFSGAHGWQAGLGSLLLAGVLAPVSEELYFRGFVYPVFRSRLGVWPAVVISSCLFAALHYDLARFVSIALGGVFFALACERTRSLYPAILAHSTWNTLSVLIIILAGSPA